MNKAQLLKKLLKQRERDHQRAEFAERKLEAEAPKPPYNTGQYNTVVTKIYRAGRAYLIRIPKSVVEELQLKPMDLVTVFIKKEEVESDE